MKKRSVLFFLNLHPFNWPVAFLSSLCFYRVIYWKSSHLSSFLSVFFKQIDPADFLDSDDWQILSERAYETFQATAAECLRRKTIFCKKILGVQIDFLRSWLQWLAYHFDEHYKFLELVKIISQNEKEGKVIFAETFLYVNRLKLHLAFPYQFPSIVFFGWLDCLWLWFYAVVSGFRDLLPLFNPTSKIPKINDRQKIHYFFAGIGHAELADKAGKLDFAFMVKRRLLNPEECLYILLKTPSQAAQTELRNWSIKWSVQNQCLAGFDFYLRLKVFVQLFVAAAAGFFNHQNLPAAPILLRFSLKGLPWMALIQNTNPRVYAASQSASWPEEPAVAVMNAAKVHTINWFYSTNNYGVLSKNNIRFQDKNLENSIWVSNEVLIWSDAVKDWLRHRHVMPVEFPVKFTAIGPLMCGNFEILSKNSSEIREHFELDKNKRVRFIVVFDVPAVEAKARSRLGIGPLMYTSEINNQFYTDLLHVINNIDHIGFILKPKRPLTDTMRHYSKAFWNLANEQSEYRKQKRVIILPHDADPYLAFVLSSYFIGLPFTSPVLFGLRFGCRAIFHDPLNTFKNFFPTKMENMITRSPKELIDRIRAWGTLMDSRNADPNHSLERSYYLGPEGDPAVRFSKILRGN